MEEKIWLASDWHFSHQKPFIYEPRGYKSPEEMNEDLIARHNALVGIDDDVYVLGDLCLGGSERLTENQELIKRMNGLLHIVIGNHDSAKRVEMYSTLPNVVEIQNAIYLKYNGYHFYLSHYPTMTSNWDDEKGLKHRTLNLCGHSHTTDRWLHWMTGSYHVEADAHNNSPVLLDDIIADMKQHQNAISGDTMFKSGHCVRCLNYDDCEAKYSKKPCQGFINYKDQNTI